jgi:HD-GYP domain-containing protein (c-di-GMP phosphodiesterase class II)
MLPHRRKTPSLVTKRAPDWPGEAFTLITDLPSPICTLDGNELFAAGSVVKEDTILSSFSSSRNPAFAATPLLQYGPFETDVLGFLAQQPYAGIFSAPDTVNTVMQELGKITLPVPVLESMLYFRRNDPYTYRHFLQVFALSTLVAKALAVDGPRASQVAATGPIHDIGKISIPLGILQKDSPLTREEKSLLNEHSVAGYVLIRYYCGDSEPLAAQVALEHHERRDGSGIPRGIALEDMMVEIIAVCDIYDALISPRPYREISYDNRTALEELCRMAEDGKIGWEAVKVLISCNRETKPHFSKVSISDEKRGIPPKGNKYGIIID